MQHVGYFSTINIGLKLGDNLFILFLYCTTKFVGTSAYFRFLSLYLHRFVFLFLSL